METSCHHALQSDVTAWTSAVVGKISADAPGAVDPTLVRLSVRIEQPDDLVADLLAIIDRLGQ